MRSRPAWLALGIIVAAGSASYQPLGGDSWVALAAAALPVAALALAALACGARGRHTLAEWLAMAALGGSLVAARLALGLLLGTGPVETTLVLPQGAGPWSARVETAHVSQGLQIATIDLAGTGLRCSGLLPAWPRLSSGDEITWSGRASPLTDGDYDRYLAGQGIAATCDARTLTLVRHDDSPSGRLETLRQASGDALQKVLPEPGGGLAAAILIGLRDRVDRNLAAAFTTAGVSHIVAISGWNIAIVGAMVGAALRGLASRRNRAVVTLAAIVLYTLFAGASASVVRAAVMAAVALLAAESGRGSRVQLSLAWAAAAMLLADPHVVTDVGFQLSAAATAGLVAWATPLTRRIRDRFPRIPGFVCESLGISLAAQVATLPIALATFGRLALIAPAANLAAVPLVPPAMAAGALALAAGWLAVAGLPVWLAGLLALPAHLLLTALIAVVDLAAAVPGANETLPFPFNVAAAGLALAVVAWLNRELGRPSAAAAGRSRAQGTAAPNGDTNRKPRVSRRMGWAAAGAVLLLAAAGSIVAAAPDGAVHVVVLDVGQGDAILVEGDRGSRMLVDGGPDGNVLLAQLDRHVPAWDRHLDAVLLTHPHDDHVGGLAALMGRYRVDRVFESGWPETSAACSAWKASLAAAGVSPARLAAGAELRLDDASLKVLWPDDGTRRPAGLDPAATDNRKTNDSSIVLLGDYDGRRFLLTGDMEDDVDPLLLDRGLPVVDMLKVPHHGSATASSEALLTALHPAVAVISVGADNAYGHPSQATLGRLRAHASAVLRTDQDGSVETTLDRAGVRVTASGRSSTRAETPFVLGASRQLPVGSLPSRLARRGVTASEAMADPVRPGFALLYDLVDVRAQPPRERGSPPVARSSAVAPPTLASGGGNRGLAGEARRVCRSERGPPAGRSGRAPA